MDTCRIAQAEQLLYSALLGVWVTQTRTVRRFTEYYEHEMRNFSLICALALLVAIAEMPIYYYTFLRLIITYGAIAIVLSETDKGINYWVVIFGIIAILFNPLIPIYLRYKDAWIPIDLVCSLLFGVKAFVPATVAVNLTQEEKNIAHQKKYEYNIQRKKLKAIGVAKRIRLI